MMDILVFFFAALPLVSGQAGIWAQCGGIGFSGPTTCVSGSCCTYSNPYYSQCLPCTGGGASSSSSKTSSTTVTSSASTSTTSSAPISVTSPTSTSTTSSVSTSVTSPASTSVPSPIGSGQAGLWSQCGGIGFSGPTTCVSGSCCTYSNPYYSQCLPCTGGGASSSSSKASSTSMASSSSSSIPPTSITSSTSSTIMPTSMASSASSSNAVSTIISSTASPTTQTTTPTQQPSGSFTNPVIYEDFPDNDVSLGPDGAYYMSTSNMHFSPGAPILRSYDLVNWEFVGHSVPTLAFGNNYNMVGGTAYREGTWASTLRYRNSTGLWYWYGCIDFWNSYVYTAPAVTGPWTQSAMFSATCFYDCGLFIDDDDTMYIVYGSNTVSIAQLASNGLSIAKTQQVFSTPSSFSGIEGNRMYKRNGLYYVLDDAPGVATLIWKSTSPWGPWTEKTMIDNVAAPSGLGGSVEQGSLIETPAGDWYFMSFAWSYPSGRQPVLAPITWGSDGYPALVTAANGAWGDSYPNPLPSHPLAPWTGTDTFNGTSLAAAWEWNHNPDTTKYTVNNGITLSTATLTTDIFHARNTLTHRVYGPLSTATILLDTSNMADGDSCGLAAFRDWTAYIGISRSGAAYTIANVQGALQNSTNDWATITDGAVVASAPIARGKVWLRGVMQTTPSSPHQVYFEYSVDGSTFVALGGSYTLNTDYSLFVGYRWGIFNFATKALGGSVLLSSFTMS